MTERNNTSARGNLSKVNLDGCRDCEQVYISPEHARQLGINSGWYDPDTLSSLQGPQSSGSDNVFRIRGRQAGTSRGGNKHCPDHRG